MSQDPMERLIADALDCAGIAYVSETENPSRLDFRLHNGIEIEVKRFHSDRIGAQMARADNVIAVQGEQAVRWFAQAIRDMKAASDPLLDMPGNGKEGV